jgi:hypothetical protein
MILWIGFRIKCTPLLIQPGGYSTSMQKQFYLPTSRQLADGSIHRNLFLKIHFSHLGNTILFGSLGIIATMCHDLLGVMVWVDVQTRSNIGHFEMLGPAL